MCKTILFKTNIVKLPHLL